MRCDVCLFDADRWTDEDLRRTLDAVPAWSASLQEGAPDDVLADLAPHAAHLAALPRGAASADLVADVHTAWHVLADAGRVRHRGTPSATGRVVQVSTSGGGVPKRAVARAVVTASGLEGDRQQERRHHGRPWQAVCLWSAEVVADLVAQGHPLGWGSTGENLTLAGLPWSQVRPGVQLLVGSALLEVTTHALPCRKNAHWFSDGRFRRIAHEVTPGASRVYARVLVEGVVAPGDSVLLEPVVALTPQQRPAERTVPVG